VLGVKELLHEYMEPLLRRFLLDPCAPVAAGLFLLRRLRLGCGWSTTLETFGPFL